MASNVLLGMAFAAKPIDAGIGGAVGALVGSSVGGGSPLVVAAATGVGAALGCQLDPVGMALGTHGFNVAAGGSGYDVKLALGAGALSYLVQSMGLFGLSGVMQGAVSGAGASAVLVLSGM